MSGFGFQSSGCRAVRSISILNRMTMVAIITFRVCYANFIIISILLLLLLPKTLMKAWLGWSKGPFRVIWSARPSPRDVGPKK